MTEHLSTLVLHQLRLGELESTRVQRAHEHLAGCALCRARADFQAETRAEFEQMSAPAGLAEVLHPRTKPSPKRWTIGLTTFAMAAVALFALRFSEPTTHEPLIEVHPIASAEATPEVVSPPARVDPLPAEPSAAPPTAVRGTTRTKGVSLPKLEAWIQTGESARPLYKGESLGAGSRVQLRYDAMGKRFVTLAGRDTNGVVEVYGTLLAEGTGLTNAPFALTLDESKGEQAFFAIATETRPEAERVMAALATNPVRMEGAVISSVVVRKD